MVEWDLCGKWWQRGVYSVDVLCIESEQPTFLGQTSKEVVERSRCSFGSHIGQIPDHVMECRGRRVIFVDGSIEELFARGFQLVFTAKGLEKAMLGSKVRYSS